jgi:ABC-type antimicrobial peptide transport system permease subunit
LPVAAQLIVGFRISQKCLNHRRGKNSQILPAIDSHSEVITLKYMTTLLQTRVENRVAQNFKRAAKLRGKTPYAYLQQLVETAAVVPDEPRTWKNHRQLIHRLNLKPVPYNLVARMREECDEQ